MKDDKIMIPEVTSIQLFKLINHIYPAEQVTIEKLNGIFGRSKVANASVTGESIGLLVREKSSISLTEQGQNLGRALASKNLEEKRNILKELVLKNQVLEFVYSLIKEKKIMKNREIGQKISMQFNKNWKHELSYARYGTNCGEILAAAGLGDYMNGIYSLERIGSDNISEGISSPTLRFNKITKILKELNAKEKDIDTLSKNLDTKKGKLSYELTNCVDLNLIKKSGEIYSITQIGRDLINPLNKDNVQKNLFAEVLRKSPYAKVVEIIQQNDSIDRNKVGEIILHELKKEGKREYQYTLGKIFTNWLEAAAIEGVERSKKVRGKQKEKKIEVEKTEKKTISVPLKKESVGQVRDLLPEVKPKIILPEDNQNTIFQMGRLIERIEIKNSAKQDILEDVRELISVCERDVSFKPYINLISSHFKLYSEIKDYRIIEADLNFLKEKFGN